MASENPDCRIRIFTINRALADWLRSTLSAINGKIPSNVFVSAFYDFLVECVSLFEPPESLRLTDELSRERIFNSWQDFFNHASHHHGRNVFASPSVRKLVTSIASRKNGIIDASLYLRDEIIYIQSAYRKSDREKYLTDKRKSRSIPFLKDQRMACLQVLKAWEEWLNFGELCDIESLTQHAMTHYDTRAHLARIRTVFPTDFAFVDEMQDFSSLELTIIRGTVSNAIGPNRIFMVGDLNQKVYAKHHNNRLAGFNFQGRAGVLKQNFRNTRQILQAAFNLPMTYPPNDDTDDATDSICPDLSIYEGGRPIVFECASKFHLRRVLDIINVRRHSRIAVISESDHFLKELTDSVTSLAWPYHEVLRNEDLDLWHSQGDALVANLVISRLEAVKGFEFDTVIICDLSKGVIPRLGIPDGELWRPAAILYAAMTRARDELIITYVGEPSIFIHAMLLDVDLHDTTDETSILRILRPIESSEV